MKPPSSGFWRYSLRYLLRRALMRLLWRHLR